MGKLVIVLVQILETTITLVVRLSESFYILGSLARSFTFLTHTRCYFTGSQVLQGPKKLPDYKQNKWYKLVHLQTNVCFCGLKMA